MQIASYRPVAAVRATAVQPLGGASEPQPDPKPVTPPTTIPSVTGSVFGDFTFGMTQKAHDMIEFVKHPLDATKREAIYRNPCAEVSLPEKIGRFVPSLLLGAAAFLVGKVVLRLPGGGPNVGWR
jgi:hypothetical protein